MSPGHTLGEEWPATGHPFPQEVVAMSQSLDKLAQELNEIVSSFNQDQEAESRW